MQTGVVTVRIFGSLRPEREAAGLPCALDVAVPAEGVTGRELAELVELPADKVEGVFVNHTVHGLAVRIMPGDRVAFVPNDTPGPHRFFLKLYAAGKDDEA
jgi:hypothetical protein